MSSYREVVAEIRAERDRQVAAEGYSESHDDDHASGELKLAAACYYAAGTGMSSTPAGVSPVGWPWLPEQWKPKAPRRMLVIAAALYRAEIDRLKRRRERHEHLETKVESAIQRILEIDHFTNGEEDE